MAERQVATKKRVKPENLSKASVAGARSAPATDAFDFFSSYTRFFVATWRSAMKLLCCEISGAKNRSDWLKQERAGVDS